MIVFDADDFGANHNISDMCQSHDCRDKLDEFHYKNPNFKITLFAIPAEMTPEIIEWCDKNRGWVELAVHGFYHSSNYECEKMTYEEFDFQMEKFKPIFEFSFVKGFKAPGWRISNDCYEWLKNHDWWVADQAYNNNRRPKEWTAYVNDNGHFSVQFAGKDPKQINGKHYHTWDCVGNGVYELSDQIHQILETENDYMFVSEAMEMYEHE